MHGPLIGGLRLALYALWTLALIGPQALALALNLPLARRLPRIYHRVCCRLLGFRLRISGTMVRGAPVLFVGNHSSYLDIPILGAVIPGSFVAKAEVAGWPVFGVLAKLQRTVFIDRRRGSTQTQRAGIAERLAAGEAVILFPEGTSNDGTHLKPFKSALLAAADLEHAGPDVWVQPVSVVYARCNGLPVGYGARANYAWYGDMALAGHFWRVAGLGRTEVDVHFHPPVQPATLGNRKALTRQCEQAIRARITAVNAGRLEPVPLEPATE